MCERQRDRDRERERERERERQREIERKRGELKIVPFKLNLKIPVRTQDGKYGADVGYFNLCLLDSPLWIATIGGDELLVRMLVRKLDFGSRKTWKTMYYMAFY